MTEFTPWSPALGRKAEMMPRFEEDAEAWKLEQLRMIDPEVHVYGDIAILIYKEGYREPTKDDAPNTTGK